MTRTDKEKIECDNGECEVSVCKDDLIRNYIGEFCSRECAKEVVRQIKSIKWGKTHD